MRAVNLLPSDLRGAAPKPARSARPEPVQGIGAYVVLGALALCVAAFAGYVITTNGIKQRKADLVAAQQRTTAANAKAAALKPYADFQALASARVETVRGLAAARFDWERALRDISHAVPAEVKLSALNGDMGLPGTQGTGGDPLRGSIQAPAITMTGCAPSQTGVARMMSRVKGVDGVTRVSLSKSEAAASAAATTTGASPCKGDNPATFSLVVFFERASALSAFAASGAAAAASSVPVPNAVNQANGAAGAANGTQPTDGTQPADGTTPATTDPAAQQPQASTSEPTSTTTSTTAGGTP
jgi:Tfp pilus assembly protein PilN